MSYIEKINEINKLFDVENKEKVVKSMEYNFYAIENMENTILINLRYLREKDIKGKYFILKEIFIKSFYDFLEYMEQLPQNIKEDISDEKKLISRINNNEECFSQEEMQKGITYKLQDGRFFQFFKADNGFSFSLFNSNGELQDGGMKLYRFFEVNLDNLPKNYILEELSKMISPVFKLEIIKDENSIRLEDGLYEECIKQLIKIEKNKEKEERLQ